MAGYAFIREEMLSGVTVGFAQVMCKHYDYSIAQRGSW
jgi:hypothetical protein